MYICAEVELSHEIIKYRNGNSESSVICQYVCQSVLFVPVLPRIMNFGRIRIPNIIRIFKNDEYEYEYYSEFKKLFEYYSWEIFE